MMCERSDGRRTLPVRLLLFVRGCRFQAEAWDEHAVPRLFDAMEIFVLLHVAANLFYTFVKKDPLIQGMASGWKPAADYADQKSAQPGSWAAAAACFAVAAAIVFGGIIAAGGKL